MDPRQIFADERLRGFCVFCGAPPQTRDHCPSQVLLDDPLPTNLPVVDACGECNNGFSLDEQYVACAIEVARVGTTDPMRMSREKIQRILLETPALRQKLDSASVLGNRGETSWGVEMERAKRVISKLARGHIAFDLSLPRLEAPLSVEFAPMHLLTHDERLGFEATPPLDVWPEVGSRAFIRASKGQLATWTVVQPGRYRYWVTQHDGDAVRIVLSEYLACQVSWE